MNVDTENSDFAFSMTLEGLEPLGSFEDVVLTYQEQLDQLTLHLED